MQQISPIKKRILQVLDFKRVSRYKFYKESGITRGVLDKKSGISEDNVAKFIAYFDDISIEWLMTGKGGMLKNETVVAEKPEPDQSYIIEVQAKLIDKLEEEVKELKKAREPRSTYRNVAEPGQ